MCEHNLINIKYGKECLPLRIVTSITTTPTEKPAATATTGPSSSSSSSPIFESSSCVGLDCQCIRSCKELRSKLYELTRIAPERQKIIVGGGVGLLRDQVDEADGQYFPSTLLSTLVNKPVTLIGIADSDMEHERMGMAESICSIQLVGNNPIRQPSFRIFQQSALICAACAIACHGAGNAVTFCGISEFVCGCSSQLVWCKCQFSQEKETAKEEEEEAGEARRVTAAAVLLDKKIYQSAHFQQKVLKTLRFHQDARQLKANHISSSSSSSSSSADASTLFRLDPAGNPKTIPTPPLSFCCSGYAGVAAGAGAAVATTNHNSNNNNNNNGSLTSPRNNSKTVEECLNAARSCCRSSIIHGHCEMFVASLLHISQHLSNGALKEKVLRDCVNLCSSERLAMSQVHFSSGQALAELLDREGKQHESISVLLGLIPFARGLPAHQKTIMVSVLDAAGRIFASLGRFDLGAQSIQLAIRVHELFVMKKDDSRSWLGLADLFNNLAVTLLQQPPAAAAATTTTTLSSSPSFERESNVETVLLTCLDIRRRYLGPDHPGCAAVLQNLGGVYASLGDRQKSVAALRDAWNVLQRSSLGPCHPQLAVVTGLLASATCKSSDNPSVVHQASSLVEYLLEQRKRERKQTGGHPDPADADLLCQYARILSESGDAARGAEKALEECLAIREASLGPDHPGTARAAQLLGIHRMDETLLLRALDCHQKFGRLEPGNCGTPELSTLLYLALCCSGSKRFDEALKYLQWLWKLEEACSRMLLTERDKKTTSVMDPYRDISERMIQQKKLLEQAASLTVAVAMDVHSTSVKNEIYVRLAFGAVVRLNEFTKKMKKKSTKTKKNWDDHDDADDSDDHVGNNGDVGANNNYNNHHQQHHGHPSPFSAQPDRFEALIKLEEDLNEYSTETSIAILNNDAAAPPPSNPKPSDNATVAASHVFDQLIEKLPRDSCLVEVVEYRSLAEGRRSYAAFIIVPDSSNPSLFAVPLGRAASTDSVAAAFVRASHTNDKISLKEHGCNLRSLLMDPILNKIGEVSNVQQMYVTIMSSGGVDNVPISLLPMGYDENSGILADRLAVQNVSTPFLLMSQSATSPTPSSPSSSS